MKPIVDVVEGMQFDRGFLSPHFVTNQDEVTVELEDCYVLLFEEKISNNKKMIPLLEAVSKAKKPLLVIAEDVEGEALATLVVNKMRGILSVCAVKAPGYGDRRKAIMGDIAVLTGGKAIFKDLGIDLESVKLSDLGRAKKIRITSEATTIVGGAGKKADIEGRVAADSPRNRCNRQRLRSRKAARASGQIGRRGRANQCRCRNRDRNERAEGADRRCSGSNSSRLGRRDRSRRRCRPAALSAAVEKLEKATEGDEKLGVRIIKNVLDQPAARNRQQRGTRWRGRRQSCAADEGQVRWL